MGRGGEERQSERASPRGSFCDCRDSSLCLAASWGYKGHQCQANKDQRQLCAQMRARSCTSFWWGQGAGKWSDSKELSLLEEDAETSLWTHNATVCIQAIARGLVRIHTDTHNGRRQTVAGTIAANTDGWEANRQVSLPRGLYVSNCNHYGAGSMTWRRIKKITNIFSIKLRKV